MAMGTAMNFLQQLSTIAVPPDVHILGPIPAPMEKRAGRFRTQLLLQCAQRAPLHQALNLILEQARKLPEGRQCRWHLDVDPIDML
jgi:primosomal protein N' (replication factor Y)